ncbi:tRNA preQ1(34) S-adenosylmethionine ribosyltransferase-isomerase QueA [Deinococcus yavapaiensis]|uniref:S-adenosylmethionine:tRNA ribosyltransferase-isomerase n=1 Tax=Deinococcus yavapaiensis KR-236 TaxID=694435 RepID=A0A318S8M4_9DEIO|nr:tRNA preQ1(34) S-adenosylmethionine ribosyltransferase-isomerase QueA [Deinococcus yavapaiensis]PYE54885.1 S-adenosylmethionine:tRNA ribosyltransferase-isomerase [Deinococcus yavapaiensis KR-236]
MTAFESARLASGDDVLAYLDFHLPEDRIAQTGAEPRDASRLMIVGEEIRHRIFRDLLEYLEAGDVLVFNESKVIPARLEARKPTGGKIEVLLLREERPNTWSAMLKPAKRAGDVLHFDDLRAEIVGQTLDGARLLKFDTDVKPHLDRLGSLPLPPYIHENVGDRYQTVYARVPGSVAAPTAGLHFTPELLAALEAKGVRRAHLNLHVGAGTFKPVAGSVEQHVMHEETFEVPRATADLVNEAKRSGRRVVAVGTTVVRALESVWDGREVRASAGETGIFIKPGHTFGAPDMLVTNFHLPKSTLLLLVAAFAGVERIKAAYEAGLRDGYRFYSLGDAMLLERQNVKRSAGG